jgi:hypothetical protein
MCRVTTTRGRMNIPIPAALTVSTLTDAPLKPAVNAQPAQTQQPEFVTTTSLLTFTGGSAAVTVLWKVAASIFNIHGRWLPAIFAALVGFYLLLGALENDNMSLKDKYGAGLVALANTAVLWSSAVGLDVGLHDADVVNTAVHG